MDVTRLSGASRAAESRAPAARSTGPAFESFLPSAGEADARPAAGRDADRIARAERQRSESQRQADSARQAEERRADERRAEDRQARDRELEQQRAADAEQRAEERRAEEQRAEEQRAEERRAEEQRAERIEAREAADAQALAAEAALPTDAPRIASPSPDAAPEGVRLRAVQPDRAGLDGSTVAREAAGADPTSPESALAAAPGVQGLAQWLRSRPELSEGPRAQRALELAQHSADADSDPTVDAKTAMVDADADPTAELTRLLEGRTLTGDLLEPGGRETARRGDSVRIGPQPQGAQPQGAQPQGPHIGPGLTPLSPTAHIADSAAAGRAGATPTALPQGVDESSIMRQISDALRLKPGRIGRPQTAEIQLHPAELGRVRVRIHMDAGTARVEVAAEHAGVSDLLAASLEQLRRDLMAQGVHVAYLEVRSGLADEGEQRREAPEHDEADEPEPAPEAAPRVTGRQPRGRIDVEA